MATTYEQTRKGVSGALLQDLKQHRTANIQALLDGGIRTKHFYDESNQPTPLSALYDAVADLYLGVAPTPNPEVDAQQVFGLMEKAGYPDWARSFQSFFYSMNGDGRGFQPDRAIPLIKEEWRRNQSLLIGAEARLRIESGEDPGTVNNEMIAKILGLDAEHRNQEVRSGTALEADLIAGIPSAVPTGCRWFDALCRGVYVGQVSILVAASGQGKTSVAVDLAAAGVRTKQYTVMIEEEMSASVIRVRIACNLAEVSEWQMREYGKENWLKLFEAGYPLGLNEEVLTRDDEDRLLHWRTQMNIYLRIYGKSSGSIRSIIRRHRAEWGYVDENDELIPMICIWDHIGYSIPEGSYNTSTALKLVAEEAVSAAADEQVAIISFSQPGANTRKHLMEKGKPDEDPQAALSSEIKNNVAHFICFVRDDGRDEEGVIREDALGKNLTKFFLCKDRFEGLENIVITDYNRDHYTYSIEQVGAPISVGAPA